MEEEWKKNGRRMERVEEDKYENGRERNEN